MTPASWASARRLRRAHWHARATTFAYLAGESGVMRAALYVRVRSRVRAWKRPGSFTLSAAIPCRPGSRRGPPRLATACIPGDRRSAGLWAHLFPFGGDGVELGCKRPATAQSREAVVQDGLFKEPETVPGRLIW